MIRIKQAVIVEGKYDKIKLSSLLDTVIIQTDGFGIFKNKDKVIHAYIPDIIGKEKRKSAPSQEGKLGVEGIPSKILMESLERAGITCEEAVEPGRKITKNDLYEDGLSGRPNSKALKKKLLSQLHLPEHLSSNALVQILNLFMTYDEYKQAVQSCCQ